MTVPTGAPAGGNDDLLNYCLLRAIDLNNIFAKRSLNLEFDVGRIRKTSPGENGCADDPGRRRYLDLCPCGASLPREPLLLRFHLLFLLLLEFVQLSPMHAQQFSADRSVLE